MLCGRHQWNILLAISSRKLERSLELRIRCDHGPHVAVFAEDILVAISRSEPMVILTI